MTEVINSQVSFRPVELRTAQGLNMGGLKGLDTGLLMWRQAGLFYPVAHGLCKHNPTDRNTKMTVSKRADRTTVS